MVLLDVAQPRSPDMKDHPRYFQAEMNRHAHMLHWCPSAMCGGLWRRGHKVQNHLMHIEQMAAGKDTLYMLRFQRMCVGRAALS